MKPRVSPDPNMRLTLSNDRGRMSVRVSEKQVPITMLPKMDLRAM